MNIPTDRHDALQPLRQTNRVCKDFTMPKVLSKPWGRMQRHRIESVQKLQTQWTEAMKHTTFTNCDVRLEVDQIFWIYFHFHSTDQIDWYRINHQGMWQRREEKEPNSSMETMQWHWLQHDDGSLHPYEGDILGDSQLPQIFPNNCQALMIWKESESE